MVETWGVREAWIENNQYYTIKYENSKIEVVKYIGIYSTKKEAEEKMMKIWEDAE